MIDPLSRLAIINGTDKFGYHDYTPNYFRLLEGWQDRDLRMLEIGVGGYGDEDRGGESLETWRDFFPLGHITGIDIQRKTMDLGPRVRIMQGSQVDAEFLDEILTERGPFDIILDDGSHRNEHVVETFGMLFPKLKSGGVYIVEDVQTAFVPRFGGSLDLAHPNSVGFFAALMQSLPAGDAGSAVSLERFHNLIVIHKRDPDAVDASCHRHRGLEQAPDVHRIAGSASDLADALDSLCAAAAHGEMIVIEGWPADTTPLHDLFVQVDHREIAVAYPDAPIRPAAKSVLSFAAYSDGLVLEVGDNSYPSNFAYDHTHPRAAAAIDAMGEVLKSPDARPNGLLQYAGMMQRFRGPEAAFDLLDRLSAVGSTERRYFQLSNLRAIREKDGESLARLNESALQHYPGDAQFSATLARAYQMLGQVDRAEEALRRAYAENPKGRPVVVALAQLEQRAGRTDEAIRLFEESINLFPKPARPPRLEQLILLCTKSDRPDRAIRACNRWLALEPDNPKATELLAGLS